MTAARINIILTFHYFNLSKPKIKRDYLQQY